MNYSYCLFLNFNFRYGYGKHTFISFHLRVLPAGAGCKGLGCGWQVGTARTAAFFPALRLLTQSGLQLND